MDMKEAQRISKIVNKYQRFDEFIEEFEEVTSGKLDHFIIHTIHGSIRIPCNDIESAGNKMLCAMHEVNGEHLESIEKELNQ